MSTQEVEPDHFVGRRRELQMLRAAMDRAAAGDNPVVEISGEVGIGKTRLLSEFSRIAESAGFGVCHGRGIALERELPFGLIAAALDAPVAELEPVELKRLGEERLAKLGIVFPALADEGGALAGSSRLDRFRCHDAIRELLGRLVRDRPMVLILDDAHWSDPESLEVVSYLIRRGVPHCLLVLAFRQGARPLLADLLRRSMREAAAHRLEIGPLTVAEVAELVGAEFSAAGLEALSAESGGNPFYLRQLARVPPQRWVPVPVPERPDGKPNVPLSIVASVSEELSLWSEDARALARAAAVAGESFDFDLVIEIAGSSVVNGHEALDELISAGIVVPTDVIGRLTFRLPIVRRAVYDGAGYGWRLGAHRRAFAALRARSAPVSTLAHHVLCSGEVLGDEAAISLLTDAGHAASAHAPASAARFFEGALRRLEKHAEPERRLSLLLPLAAAYCAAGRHHDCRRVLEQALDQVPPEDRALRTRITTMIVRAAHSGGCGRSVRDLLDETMRDVPPGNREAAELAIELARNRLLAREWPEAAAAAGRALTLAEALGEQDLRTAASALDACTAVHRGVDLDQARTVLDLPAASVDAMPDDAFDHRLLESMAFLTVAELTVERFEASGRHAKRGLRLCRLTGSGTVLIEFLHHLAFGQMMRGYLTDARRNADSALDACLLLGNDGALAFTEGTRAWIAALLGRTHTALTASQHSIDAARRALDPIFAWHAGICRGVVLFELGRLEQAKSAILEAGCGQDLASAPTATGPHWLRILTLAELAAGRIDEADSLARRAELAAEATKLRVRIGDARFARAHVLCATGELEAARDVAQASFDAYRVAGTVLEAARVRMLIGQIDQDLGDLTEAAHQFKLAHATFGYCGAARLAGQAAHAVRGLGHRVPRTTRRAGAGTDGPHVLSDREWQIARLVAKGYTNRRIADDLYLSPKTVEAHLTRIFGKLGVPSRAAVAAALETPDH